MDLMALEEQLGVRFKDRKLLIQALTIYSTYKDVDMDVFATNERLEYLGDAVLRFVIADHVYKQFPRERVGKLTIYRDMLENTQTLSLVAEELGIIDFLILPLEFPMDKKSRKKHLCDSLEAIIGAVYLDQGNRATIRFVKKHILSKLGEFTANMHLWNPKGRLQKAALKHLTIEPRYVILRTENDGDETLYTAGVYLGKRLVSSGSAHSKKAAHQEAARKALTVQGWQSITVSE